MYITLFLTLGAPLAILIYIIRSDKFPEPTNLVLKTFFVGIFLCWPAGYLNSYIFTFENTFDIDNMSFLVL